MEVYEATAWTTIEIPSLGVNIPVVGVPLKTGGGMCPGWGIRPDGWKEAHFPSWKGNSVLTSHVYLSNGLPVRSSI